jgi:tRNA(Ile2) C34 agmatinyltransferase TiaS
MGAGNLHPIFEGRCPTCGGNLQRLQEMGRWELRCLQCGRVVDPELDPRERARREAERDALVRSFAGNETYKRRGRPRTGDARR